MAFLRTRYSLLIICLAIGSCGQSKIAVDNNNDSIAGNVENISNNDSEESNNQIPAPSIPATGNPSTGVNRVIDDSKSLDIFKNTLYPYLRSQNCSTCHVTGNIGPVKHSDPDPIIAHADIKTIIDINEPSQSRIILKIRDELHNCGDRCAETANEIEKQLIEWIASASIEEEVPQIQTTKTKSLTIKEAENSTDIKFSQKVESENSTPSASRRTPTSSEYDIKTDLQSSNGKYIHSNGGPSFITYTHNFSNLIRGHYAFEFSFKSTANSSFSIGLSRFRNLLANKTQATNWELSTIDQSKYFLDSYASNKNFTITTQTPGSSLDFVRLIYRKKIAGDKHLSFDLSHILSKGCSINVILGDSSQSDFYTLYTPYFECEEPTELYVNGIQLYLNNKSVLGANNFIDLVQNLDLGQTEGNTALEQRSAMLIKKDLGEDNDVFSFAFNELQIGHKDITSSTDDFQNDTEDLENDEAVNRFQDFHNLMYNKCMSCHGFNNSSGNAVIEPNYDQQDYVDLNYTRTQSIDGRNTTIPNSKLIVPGDLENSRIWKRANGTGTGRGTGRMPQNSSLTDSEKEIIRQFILNF